MLRKIAIPLAVIALAVAAVLCTGLLTKPQSDAPVHRIRTEGADFSFVQLSAPGADPETTQITNGSTTPLFSSSKPWEPGFTQVEYFSLDSGDTETAFTYTFSLEGSGLTEFAQTIHVYYAVTDTQFTSRNDIANMEYLGTLSQLLSSNGGQLFRDEATGSVQFAVALQMNPNADNTYQGVSLFQNDDGRFTVSLNAQAIP